MRSKFRFWNKKTKRMEEVWKLEKKEKTLKINDIKSSNEFLMISTQTKDFNGSEIFEGDILCDIDDNYCYGEVYYDKELSSFYVANYGEAFQLCEIGFTSYINGHKFK